MYSKRAHGEGWIEGHSLQLMKIAGPFPKGKSGATGLRKVVFFWHLVLILRFFTFGK